MDAYWEKQGWTPPMREWVQAGRLLKCAPGSFPDLGLTRQLADVGHTPHSPGSSRGRGSGDGTRARQGGPPGSEGSQSDVSRTIAALCQCHQLAAARIPFRTDGNPMQSEVHVRGGTPTGS